MTTELFSQIAGFVALLVGGAWGLIKVVAWQFSATLNQRFETVTAHMRDEAKQWQQIEHDLTELRIDLPKDYVRREDHIRFETVIQAKLDSLGSKMDLFAERQKG